MNKYFKKGIALAIVGMMTFGMGTTVFAETGGGTTTGTGFTTSVLGALGCSVVINYSCNSSG